MTFAQKMFGFDGRMGRQDFWICALIILGAHLAAFIIFFTIAFSPLMAMGLAAEKSGGQIDDAAAFASMVTFLPAIGIYVLFRLAIVWPSTAINVKRFHDRGQSGWLSLIFAGCTILSWIPIVGLLFSVGSFIFWLVDLGILEGTLGPNRYGLSTDPAYLADQVFA